MKTLIIGDSHGGAVAQLFGTLQAHDVWDQTFAEPVPVLGADGSHQADYLILNRNQQIFAMGPADRLIVAPAFATRISHYNVPGAKVFMLFQGNEHNARFMCRRETPFDFVCPFVTEHMALGHQIVPRKAVIRQFQGAAAIVMNYLQAVQATLPDAQRYFILPPPPIPDAQHIKAHAEGFDFEARPLEDKWIRLKTYLAYTGLLTYLCNTLKLPVLKAPEEAMDQDGFLLPCHWSGCTHASSSFYEAMFKQNGFPLEASHASL